jgi:hypothetical protein
MSDEISMAQKLELVRTAISRGFSAGDSGPIGFSSPPPPPAWEPFSMSTDVQEGNRVEPPPFPPAPIEEGAGASPAETGAFFGMRTVSSGDATNGDIYLQGGQVTAGSGTVSIPEFLLFDASGPTWSGTAGQHLSIRLNGTGSEADDVLMPTFDLTTVSGPTALTPPLPDNVLPEIGALTGECVVSLGTFTSVGFLPAASGNIQASFCFGGFTVSRF